MVIANGGIMSQEFSKRLKLLREDRSMTLDQLAKKVDSTKSYIWDLENKEKIRPAAEIVYKLAQALEVTVEALMGESANNQDEVFFREYKGLNDNTKSRIQKILNALKEED